MSGGSASLLLLVFSQTACQEEHLPPLEWETDRARIGSRLDGLELCHEDLTRLDEHVAFIEDMLGIEHLGKLEIQFYDLDELPCSVSPTGCFRRDTDQIHLATWDGVDHEIVHAISRDLRHPSLFWDEGVADPLGWVGALDRDVDPLDNL